MPELPVVSGRVVVRAFQKCGWTLVRQRGSHMILVKAGNIASLCVPDHREVARGTLRSLIRHSGITVEKFNSLLK
jgi:predicted RNA binding protein YcfA (HicA-like mRNA interferase family)